MGEHREKTKAQGGKRRERETRATRSKHMIFRRTVILMGVMGILAFVPLLVQIFRVSIVKHDEYQKMAAQQQTMDISLKASRGEIRDRGGNVMAVSATVYDLILSPRDLVASVSKAEFTTKEDGKKTFDQEGYDRAVSAKQTKVVDDLVQMIPGLSHAKVTEQVMDTSKAYKQIKLGIEDEEAEKIRTYISQHKTGRYLYLQANTKRYYPYGSMGAQVLGFVNDKGGAYGIEAIYDEALRGVPGRVVTTKTARGIEMFNGYSKYVDAQNGLDLTLTIDSTIQSYVEKTLEEGIKEFDVRNGAFCIAMDPNTGAVLGMASSPGFDPNNYAEVTDPILKAQIPAETQKIYAELKAENDQLPQEHQVSDGELQKKAKTQATNNARNAQWRSKAIDSRYQPGSTFKALVLAAALEEGVVDENDTFECSGIAHVPGLKKGIRCSKRSGHGHQTLAEAVQNSCNPAFMNIGSRLGIDTYLDYFEAFGLKDKTGIDLPGEASTAGNVWERDKMTQVDLAVGSFGQQIEVTPIQMITALSAAINGGRLLEPYVVQSISSDDGTVLKNTEPTVVRQVVSQQTSRRVVDILESVVAEGTGNNAYVPGYRIGGKTGSSETNEEGRTIVSFTGFAPVDDPKVIVLLAYDKPQEESPGSNWSTTGVYISGGNMAAKKVGPLIADILDYMGVEKQYTEEESAAVNVRTPAVLEKTLAEAKEALSKKNLKFRTVGTGDTVRRQIPGPYAPVPGGSTVVLYLDDTQPAEEVVVPNVVGLTYDAARAQLEEAGLFMRSTGVSTYYGNTTTATDQSIEPGKTVKNGTVVKVQFVNMVEDGPTGPIE